MIRDLILHMMKDPLGICTKQQPAGFEKEAIKQKDGSSCSLEAMFMMFTEVINQIWSSQ